MLRPVAASLVVLLSLGVRAEPSKPEARPHHVTEPARTEPPAVAPAAPPQHVVVHLSHFTNDLHATFMALDLATAMARQGAKVTLMLDLEGARLADARLPSQLQFGHGDDLAKRLESFAKAGGSALLCPHCAHVAGVDPAHLRPGMRVAAEGELARLVLQANKVIDF